MRRLVPIDSDGWTTLHWEVLSDRSTNVIPPGWQNPLPIGTQVQVRIAKVCYDIACHFAAPQSKALFSLIFSRWSAMPRTFCSKMHADCGPLARIASCIIRMNMHNMYSRDSIGAKQRPGAAFFVLPYSEHKEVLGIWTGPASPEALATACTTCPACLWLHFVVLLQIRVYSGMHWPRFCMPTDVQQ